MRHRNSGGGVHLAPTLTDPNLLSEKIRRHSTMSHKIVIFPSKKKTEIICTPN